MVQYEVAKLAKTAIDYLLIQNPASFNLHAVKRQIEPAIKQHHGQ
jgi:arylsulfatase